MPSSDSIEFFANYNGWIVNQGIEISDSARPEDIAYSLAAIREAIDRRAFEILGIDTKEIDAYSEAFSKSFPKGDYKSLATAYKSLGSEGVGSEMAKATNGKEELKPFAKVYLLRATAKRLGLDWYISADNKAIGTKAKVQKNGKAPYPGIAFMAKYKDWISIKKLSVSDDTKPEEIAAHLSSIRMTVDRKIPQILGVNTGSLDIYAAASTGKMRKSFANMEKIVDILCSDGTKKQVTESIRSESVRGVAVIYLFSRMLQNIKVDLEVSPETLMAMFPGLKIPKPRGRTPKK